MEDGNIIKEAISPSVSSRSFIFVIPICSHHFRIGIPTAAKRCKYFFHQIDFLKFVVKLLEACEKVPSKLMFDVTSWRGYLPTEEFWYQGYPKTKYKNIFYMFVVVCISVMICW